MANFFTEGITITHSHLSSTDLGRSSGMFKISIRTSPAWRRRSASCCWAGAAAESKSAAMVKLKIFFIILPSLDLSAGRQVIKINRIYAKQNGSKIQFESSRSFKLYHLRRLPMRLSARFMTVLLLCTAFISTLQARVMRVEITSRIDIDNGKPFGAPGAYEKITGRVYFAVDPANPHNRQIVDLDKAPRNAKGEVEFSADLYLLKPKDMNKGNGSVLFEVSNRGGKGILRIVNGVTSSDPKAEFGDGFLMREGYTVAWVGWEADLAEQGDRLRLFAPVAHDPGGKTIRGMVRSDFTPAQKLDDIPLGHFLLGPTGGKSYPVDDPNSTKNILTVRGTPDGLRKIIPRSQWSFAHAVDGHLLADPHYLHLESGFQPGKIYEVVYEAKDPVVAGLGLASVRDFLSYLKYDPQSTAPVHRVYAVGISQSGRFLRHFLFQDFNADEQGRQVMDGVIAHVAGAGRGSFNHRFAQPSRDAQPLSSIFFPTDLFPFTDLPETDPESGETAGLLDAPSKSHTTPKIFFTNTSR